MTEPEAQDGRLVAVLHECARAAGAVLLDRYRRRDFVVDAKGTSDLVTSADHAAEAEILGRIRATFPGHAVLAEESGLQGGDGSATWYIDPLDGTTNFAHFLPFWCTSLAVEAAAGQGASVVYAPQLDEFFASGEAGATLNGQAVGVRSVPLARALVYGNIGDSRGQSGEAARMIAVLTPRIHRVRMMGSLAMGLAYVAAGRFDGVLQTRAAAWDFMAGAALVRAAGGLVSDPDGGPLGPRSVGVIAAATPEMHGLLLEAAASQLQPGS